MKNNVLVKFRNNRMRLVMKNGQKKTAASFWFGDDEIKKMLRMDTGDREIFIDIEAIIVVMKYDSRYAIDLCNVHRNEYTGVATGSRISVTIPENKLFEPVVLIKTDEYRQAKFTISPVAKAKILKMRHAERRAFLKTLMTHFMSANGEDVSLYGDTQKDFYFMAQCHGGIFSQYDGGICYEEIPVIGRDKRTHMAVRFGKYT